ncbi:unnamed protein product [Closterium sp. Naga37s-1]|nr:unnamed protein product [Closterium sp. Naga37s-1]
MPPLHPLTALFLLRTPSFNSSSSLPLPPLQQVGDHFVSLLLAMKHNGAVDKTRAGSSHLSLPTLPALSPPVCLLSSASPPIAASGRSLRLPPPGHEAQRGRGQDEGRLLPPLSPPSSGPLTSRLSPFIRLSPHCSKWEITSTTGPWTRRGPAPPTSLSPLFRPSHLPFVSFHPPLPPLQQVGDHFVSLLLAMKHNGAVDKTRAGFIALTDRLLRCPSPALNALPRAWLTTLQRRLTAPHQTLTDLIRRSAGLPAAFLGLFLGEPQGAPKVLLPRAVAWLLEVVRGTERGCGVGRDAKGMGDDAEGEGGEDWKGGRAEQAGEALVPGPATAAPGVQAAATAPALSLKAREEGVVAAVHAWNVLRLAFHDTHLATDTSAFCSPALQAAVAAARSPHWEVRNAGGLCLVALLHRMLGFKNVPRAGRPWAREQVVCKQTARQSMTALEFFLRYPDLHAFFLRHLREAALAFLPPAQHLLVENPPADLPHPPADVSPSSATTASATTITSTSSSSQPLHPALAPALILLSRLKPSTLTSPSPSSFLSPSAFVPPVSLCAAHPHMHVRELAARALVPILASTEVSGMLLKLACSLPEEWGRRGGMVGIVERRSEEDKEEECERGGEDEGGRASEAMGYNAVHGVLLQMRHLLAAYWVAGSTGQAQQQQQGGGEGSSKAADVQEVLQALQQRRWLGDPHMCCCPSVVAEYLTVSHLLLSSALHSSPPLSALLSSALHSSTSLSSPPLSTPLPTAPNSSAPPLTPMVHATAAAFLPLALRAFSFHPPLRFAILDPTALALRKTAASLLLSPEAVCLAGRGLWDGLGSVEGGIKGEARVGEGGECSSASVFWRVAVSAVQDPCRDVQLSALRSLSHLLASPRLLAPLLPPLHTAPHHNSSSEGEVGAVLLAVVQGVQQEREAQGRDEMRCRRLLKVLLPALSLPSLQPLLLPLLPHALQPAEAALPGTAEERHPGGPSDVPDSSAAGSNRSGCAALWAVVLEVFETARVLKTREAALRCLGHCFRLLLSQHGRLVGCGLEQQQQEQGAWQQEGAKQSVERGLTSGDFPLGQGRGTGNLLQLAATWLQLIGEQSAAHRPVSVRRAAAEAVVSSGLLLEVGRMGHALRCEPAAGGKNVVGGGSVGEGERGMVKDGEEGGEGAVMEYARVVVRAWLTVIRVMEDEDETLRKSLATAVLTITTTAAADAAHPHAPSTTAAVSSAFVPAQVERAVEAALAHVSLCLRACPPALLPAHLAAWVLHPDFVSPSGFQRLTALDRLGDEPVGEEDEEEQEEESAAESERRDGETRPREEGAAAAVRAVPGFVRRLFDREVDNHHEEPLLLAHLCCLHLQQALLLCPPSRALLKAITTWKLVFAKRFFTEAAQAARLCKSMKWVGGPTFHQDSFSALIRPLLGLWALSKVSLGAGRAECLPLGWRNKSRAEIEKQCAASSSGDGSECTAAASVLQATGKEVRRTRKLVKAAARRLQEMPVNPILQSVLSDVMQANADADADGGKGGGEGVCWETDVLWCDPLFLLHAQSYGM